MWNDTIDQGATFYREVTLYSDKAKTKLLPTEGKVPRSALMAENKKVADFLCAWLAASGEPGTPDYLPKRIAWVMPKATIAKLKTDIIYDHFIYLDSTDGFEGEDAPSYPAERGKIVVNPGC